MADKPTDHPITVGSPKELDARNKKRWMMIAACAVIIIVLGSMMFSKDKRSYIRNADPEFIDVTPGKSKDISYMKLNKQLNELKSLYEESLQHQNLEKQKNMKRDAELERLKVELIAVRSGWEDAFDELKQRDDETAEEFRKRQEDFLKEMQAREAAKEKSDLLSRENSSYKMPAIEREEPKYVPMPPRRDLTIPDSRKVFTKPNTTLAENNATDSADSPRQPVIYSPPKPREAKKPNTDNLTKNKYAGFLPASSTVRAVLISGVDAGSSEGDRENPEPVFFKLVDDAITAGDGRYQLKGCHVLATAYGNLSKERVDLKLSSITCLDTARGLVLEKKITGYVVDSDGTNGLRGKVERRAGALLARAMMAGFAEGIASVASASQQTLTSNPLGNLTTLDPKDLPKTAAFGGAEKAASIIAEQYVKEAEKMHPVVVVPNGRKATIVFTAGTALEWNSYTTRYVAQENQ